MKSRKVIGLQYLKDFSSLFFSNILQKIFGVIREPIIAYFFGSSLIFAHYLLLKTAADFFSQFTVGNALRANLLPKFTKIYNEHKNVSLNQVSVFSRKSMLYLFLFSQIFQSAIILYLDTDYAIQLFIVSVFLSVILCFNFYNTIYLTIMQSQGKFLKYSLASTLNAFVVVGLIFPITKAFLITIGFIWSILGLVFSRLLGILSLTIAYILPMSKEDKGFEVVINKKDFNLSILLLGNFANIIIISSRFVSGADGSDNITYFTYSVFLLNAVLTAIISNFNTLLLKRLSVKKELKFVFYSALIALLLGICMVFAIDIYAQDIIALIFERGKFDSTDSLKTAYYLQNIAVPFVLIFVSTIMFQPFFASKGEKFIKDSKLLALSFIVVLISGFIFLSFTKMKPFTESLIMLYLLSITSIVISIIALYKSHKYEE